jgi:hypothetical protein
MSNTDMVTELDDQQKKVLPRIEALLRLYDKGKESEDVGTLNEAHSALAKAQELLVAYNLSADLVAQGSEDGVREEQKLTGGARQYERDLWNAVAELNFCMYFSSGENKVTAYKRERPDGSKYMHREEKWQPLHRLVGRKVNVMATINMARYLEQAIERLVDERIGMDSAGRRWGRENIVFREGAASTITNKLYQRRREILRDEERKRREAEEKAQQAGGAGVSTSTALTVASHAQAEKDANNDHANGWEPGKTASLRAQWQAEQAAQAEANKRAREAHTRWCEENPEEARAMAEARRKEEEEAEKREARNAKRRTGREWRWTKADDRREEERSYYESGRRAGEKVNIDQQMGGGAKGSLGNG